MIMYLYLVTIFGLLYLPICARRIKIVVTRPCVTQEGRILWSTLRTLILAFHNFEFFQIFSWLARTTQKEATVYFKNGIVSQTFFSKKGVFYYITTLVLNLYGSNDTAIIAKILLSSLNLLEGYLKNISWYSVGV